MEVVQMVLAGKINKDLDWRRAAAHAGQYVLGVAAKFRFNLNRLAHGVHAAADVGDGHRVMLAGFTHHRVKLRAGRKPGGPA